MTSNDDTQAAADLAAAEQELAEDAAPATPVAMPEAVGEHVPVVAEVLPEDAPRRGLRAQAVELVGQVNALSAQVEAQRIELEALRAEATAPIVIPAPTPVTVIAEATDAVPVAAVELTVGARVPDATLIVASPAATTPVAEADGAADPVAPPKATSVEPVAPVAAASPIQTASETAALTFDGLMEGMDEPHREVVEKHIIGLRSALDKEREDRKGAQKAVRTAQAEIESIPTLRQQLELAEQDALDTHAQATFFEHAGSNDVKRGSARLAFLAAKDGQYFDDDGSVQWESLKARFPDLFEGTNRSAPTGVIVGTPELKDAVVSVRPAAAPRASASAGAGGGAPPRRPFSMTSAIRSAAGRSVK